MAYELYETPGGINIHGNCFIESFTTVKPIYVEGDLVADYVCAPYIRVVHGSLIVRSLNVDHCDADILGVYIDDGVVDDGWRYKWLRPIVAKPDAAKWTSEESIENVIQLFEHPALVKEPAIAHMLLSKVRKRPTCGRARVLFGAALEELNDRAGLTPLGAMVVASFLVHEDLPQHWRW